MNYAQTSKKLAAKGRNGDSMLVHMTPGEVGGLQALAVAHGTSMTINPTTGLPEAFKLKSLLPMLAGFALGPAGFALMPAWGAGMAVGGVEALRTGDIGKGLMSGLGAYGGAGLGSALTSAGASNVGNIGAQQAVDAGINVAAAPSAALPAAAPSTFMGNLDLAKQGVQSLGSPGGLANFSSELGKQFPGTMGKTAATIGLAAPFIPPPPDMAFPEEEDPYFNYEGPYTPTERQVRYPGSSRSSREFSYFTPSNPIPYAEGGETTNRAVKAPSADYNVNQGEFNYNFKPVEIAKAVASGDPSAMGGKGALGRAMGSAIGGKGIRSGPAGMSSADAKKFGYDKYTDPQGYKYDPDTQQLVKMAEGGSVPMLEDGGFVLTKKAVDGIGRGNNTQGQKAASRGLGAIPIRGKGTGTSDSIKTSIENKIPAKVSNGEAYVPKKNVRRAGGANKLYALMKKAERKV